MPEQPLIEVLVPLGFTQLEAEIYVFLLTSEPATGYKIAKSLGRTNANTYKAIDSLQAKGALLVSEAENRVCRAVPVNELLAQLKRRFEQLHEGASEAARGLHAPAADDRIYHLKTRSQVLERAHEMLASSKHVVAADLFPSTALAIRESLIAAAARGVRITTKTYEPIDLGDTEVVLRRKGWEITEATVTDTLVLNVDGRESMTAMMSRSTGEPRMAIYTASPLLSYQLFGNLIHELILTDLRQAIWDGKDQAELQAVLDKHAHLHPISSRSEVFGGFLRALGEPVETYLGTPSKREGKDDE